MRCSTLLKKWTRNVTHRNIVFAWSSRWLEWAKMVPIVWWPSAWWFIVILKPFEKKLLVRWVDRWMLVLDVFAAQPTILRRIFVVIPAKLEKTRKKTRISENVPVSLDLVKDMGLGNFRKISFRWFPIYNSMSIVLSKKTNWNYSRNPRLKFYLRNATESYSRLNFQ